MTGRKSNDRRPRPVDFEVLTDPRLRIRLLPAAPEAEPPPLSEDLAFDLETILDRQGIQMIMDDFHALTGMVTAILDLEGNVLEATGWQDLCTKFHRVHPGTARNCTESDLALAAGLEPGQYADYHCRNGLRDVVTPLYIRGRHLGNIFTGQFFYEDDMVDEEQFAAQARRYGFDVEAYLEAFRRIPRYSRETIAHLMSFLVRMTEHVSRIGLANLELAGEIRTRHEAEAEVRDSRARLRAVVRAIPDLVWMKDPDGVYLLCNERFEQLYGAPESGIVGRTDADFVDPDQAEFFRGHDRRAMQRGRPTMNIEDVEFASDGHRETLETIKTPVKDGDGRIVGVLGIGRDITARVEAEKALLENEARLRDAQRMESIGRLAAGVSHDLNNLLTPIMGYARLVAEDLPADSPHLERLGQINEAGARARDLVAQLLAFGRRQTLLYRNVDLNGAARGLEKLLRRSLRANVRMVVDLAADLPTVRADRGQVEQVIMNLALNAADAMPDGGELRIATAVREVTGDRDEGIGPGVYATLSVRDDGTGMDEETRAHIFEPFFSTKGEMGTGLGLATVHGIVKQHGGEIVVDSAPGRGSTFTVHLPAQAAGAAADEAPERRDADPAARPAAAGTILLVEDNVPVRDLTAAILVREGYRVLEAGSGEEALPLLETQGDGIDLLLTDVVMPGMSGGDLHERACALRPDLPVLFMSGFADLDATLATEDPGRGRFLRKPFENRELLELVQSLLERSRARGE